MQLDDLVFATSNLDKLREAEAVLGRSLLHQRLDLPELQSLDLHEVLRAKLRAGWQTLGRPVMVEDTGLELAALGGFPGPLIRWLLESAGPEGIARIAGCFEERRVTARCLVGVTDGSNEIFGEGVVEGVVAAEPQGEGGFGWDSIFVPDGSDRSYGQMTADEKNRISHRRLAFESLRNVLDGS
ncbi:MAG: non-canonical purine NTP pyrophosphatase [Holophagae bacterium]|jgi:non-canonical purine NTP pyrophosphatase (RdgB/HAM1 family)